MADINVNTTWFETAALNNTGTLPTWAENQPPSQVNDSAREMMGALKREFDRSHPTLTSAGTAAAYTLTYTVAPTAYVTGDIYSFIVGTTNTGACTLNVNGLGAKNIFLNKVALTGNELQSGVVVTLAYDGTQFQVANRSTVTNTVAGNLLINPLMEIDQANEGNAVTLATGVGKYGVDGWIGQFTNNTATISVSQIAPGLAGFAKALQLNITGGGVVGVNDFLGFQQPIEANNISDTFSGTAGAKQMWLQFWIRGSIGSYTMGGALRNAAGTRTYPFSFVYTTGTQWQQVFIPIPADTGGAWVTAGSAAGMTLFITGAAGANLQGTPGAWAAGSAIAPTGITNSYLTSVSNFVITGVKLEISPVPTPLLRGPFADEMIRCQRYYEKSYPTGVKPGTASAFTDTSFFLLTGTSLQEAGMNAYYKVLKRTVPTLTYFSPNSGTSGKVYDVVNAVDITASTSSVGMNSVAWFALMGGVASTIEMEVHWVADARF